MLIMNESLQYQIAVKMMQEHETLQQYTIIDVCYMLFKNLQISDNTCTGLRLTKLGNTLLKEKYDTYKFPVSEGIHNRLLLRLHDKMQWPYFLDRKNLWLFSEDDAMWLKLVSNDIEKFANSLD
tara:strand:+ start:3191 stop:3562 length:372 start_codon:yes stop_codon:yes gene_type:complete